MLKWKFPAGAISITGSCHFKPAAPAMEVNPLKRQLKDLEERIASLRGFL